MIYSCIHHMATVGIKGLICEISGTLTNSDKCLYVHRKILHFANVIDHT